MAGMTAAVPRDAKVIGLVCVPHMLSHAYFLILSPLFPVLKDVFDVSYTQLGLILTCFGLAAGLAQTPVGFVVDRMGARRLLIAGLACQGVLIALIGTTTEYWHLLVLFALVGLANTVYHPADYAILSAAVDRSRLGRAFGLHALTGTIGFVIAPVIMVTVTELWHWRAAFFVMGTIGMLFALLLWRHGDLLDDRTESREPTEDRPETGAGGESVSPGKDGLRLLLSPPILMCFLYFVFQMMGTGGLRTFLVAALDSMFGIPLTEVNTALAGLLIGSALGILVGSDVADRVGPRTMTAVLTLLPAAALVALIGSVEMSTVVLTGVLAIAGFLQGFLVPSRDLLIRSVTPDGSMGKVMGFVSSGANLAGGLVPLLFGWILDNFAPGWIFWVSAIFIGCALFTFTTVKGRYS